VEILKKQHDEIRKQHEIESQAAQHRSTMSS
jgi:hypothetical protein